MGAGMTPLAKLQALADSRAFDIHPVGGELSFGELRSIARAIAALEQALRERAAEIERELLHQAAVFRDRGDELGAVMAELRLVTRKARIRGAYIAVLKTEAEEAHAALLDR